ncbi:hypothetical protein FRB94_005868 [Tulasnella sp. JGI-2019a]|nr:hypothetical protein FRB94_005868 [Tulasnella sp. JGI-2019a]KAG9007938.1 hypothetical protein FRB93_006957 [Tulasnella sp. JGI-2019a]KAG9023885.1 hypothetical protein FRB95_012377 [Tulasnella sp. JGI-2019a]
MAPKAKAKTMIVKLVSTAQTGFFYTKVKKRTGPPLNLMKYDPQAGSHVLFKERKGGLK